MATSAAAVARAVVVEAAEAHTAVEVPAHTVTAKFFVNSKGPPKVPERAFVFSAPPLSELSWPRISTHLQLWWRAPTQSFPPVVLDK